MTSAPEQNPLTICGLLGLGHLAIEAASVAAITGLAMHPDLGPMAPWQAIALYSALAFATQLGLGWWLDRVGGHRPSAVAGCLLTALGAAVWRMAPVPAVTLCGIGNALFHVGAGVPVLRMSGGSAGLNGLFVGPGDLGVLVGVLIGHGVWPECSGWFALASVAAIVPVVAIDEPWSVSAVVRAETGRRSGATLALLCCAVLCRPLVIGWLGATCRVEVRLIAALCWVAMLAKCLGGFVADRWGWRATNVATSCVAAALLAAGATGTAAMLVTATLVQIPTGATLAAAYRRLPELPGLAFGLVTLFVYLGGPPIGRHLVPIASGGQAATVQAICAACLALALAPNADGADGTRT